MLALLSRARKTDAPPLVNAEGVPLATTPERTWCRLAISLSLVPPKVGQVFSIEQGPYTRRLVIYAPRVAMTAGLLALVSQVPGLREMVATLLKSFLGGH